VERRQVVGIVGIVGVVVHGWSQECRRERWPEVTRSVRAGRGRSRSARQSEHAGQRNAVDERVGDVGDAPGEVVSGVAAGDVLVTDDGFRGEHEAQRRVRAQERQRQDEDVLDFADRSPGVGLLLADVGARKSGSDPATT